MQQNWLDLHPLLAYLWFTYHFKITTGQDTECIYVGHVRGLHVRENAESNFTEASSLIMSLLFTK